MHTVHNAQRKMQPNVASLASRVGSNRDETSRAELRHPQLNLIKSTLGVRLRVELGLFFFMNEIVKGLGDGGRRCAHVATWWNHEWTRSKPRCQKGTSRGERQSETWAANANWWPGLRCDAHHSISGTSGQTDDRLSISHAHRNRISMIIIMSRKTGKPVKPNSLECQQMNCQMLRHRLLHSMKTFPNLSRHEWLRFSYTIEGRAAGQSAGIYALSVANGIVFQRLSTVVIVLYTKCSNIFKSLSLGRLNTVSALDNEESGEKIRIKYQWNFLCLFISFTQFGTQSKLQFYDTIETLLVFFEIISRQLIRDIVVHFQHATFKFAL